MGIAKKFIEVISSNRKLNTRLCIDLDENIHLHNRDTRLEFGIEEWEIFSFFICQCKEVISNLKYIDNGKWEKHFQLNSLKILEPESKYKSKQILLEKLSNGDYHFHYHDLRLEFDEKTFELIRNLFNDLFADTRP